MYLAECPSCKRPSFLWSKSREQYECVACGIIYTETTLLKALNAFPQEICPACRRLRCFNDPRIEKLRCLSCRREFTREQALAEEAAYQVRLAKKPYPKLPPVDVWYPNDPYEK